MNGTRSQVRFFENDLHSSVMHFAKMTFHSDTDSWVKWLNNKQLIMLVAWTTYFKKRNWSFSSGTDVMSLDRALMLEPSSVFCRLLRAASMSSSCGEGVAPLLSNGWYGCGWLAWRFICNWTPPKSIQIYLFWRLSKMSPIFLQNIWIFNLKYF